MSTPHVGQHSQASLDSSVTAPSRRLPFRSSRQSQHRGRLSECKVRVSHLPSTPSNLPRVRAVSATTRHHDSDVEGLCNGNCKPEGCVTLPSHACFTARPRAVVIIVPSILQVSKFPSSLQPPRSYPSTTSSPDPHFAVHSHRYREKPSETKVVKALRAHASHTLEVRMGLPPPPHSPRPYSMALEKHP